MTTTAPDDVDDTKIFQTALTRAQLRWEELETVRREMISKAKETSEEGGPEYAMWTRLARTAASQAKTYADAINALAELAEE